MSGRLLLIRHGEPAVSSGLCVGHYDLALAETAADDLARLAATAAAGLAPRLIVASDLRRAVDSAARFAAAWQAEVRIDPRLRELSFGTWEGRSWDDIGAADRDALDFWAQDWVHFPPPEGESGMALAARVRAVLDELLPLAAASADDVAVVSHAGWIRVAATLLLGEPVSAAFRRGINYAHAAIFTVDGAAASLAAWNVDSLADPEVRGGGAPSPAPR